ncbi:MAG: response regulator transcription factor [Candidatus Methylomirabilales bacterium]
MSASDAMVFVVDDDMAVRRSLARLIRSADLNVETFTSAREFLDHLPSARTGCIVLDVRMPGMTGPELFDQMAGKGISLPVVFLTGHGNVPTSVRAMKKGAVDFLLKPVDDEVLLQAIRRAVARHVSQQAREQRRQDIEERLLRLSAREREVMEYVIRGDLNKQIAADLRISEKTVKVHRGRVMAKMEAGSVAELVRLCEAAGIQPRQENTLSQRGKDRQF